MKPSDELKAIVDLSALSSRPSSAALKKTTQIDCRRKRTKSIVVVSCQILSTDETFVRSSSEHVES
jgi:hypothetical protein